MINHLGNCVIRYIHRVLLGGNIMSKKQLYQDLALKINKTLNRKAVTVEQIHAVVEKAKLVKKQKGTLGLFGYATKIPAHFFTENEIEKLQNSPYWEEFSQRMIQLFVHEGIISQLQASMAKKYM